MSGIISGLDKTDKLTENYKTLPALGLDIDRHNTMKSAQNYKVYHNSWIMEITTVAVQKNKHCMYLSI